MSRIFNVAPKPIHYCDTDSILVEKSIEGKVFDLTDLDGKWVLPVILENKGFGEQPLVFRSKLYYPNPNVSDIGANRTRSITLRPEDLSASSP